MNIGVIVANKVATGDGTVIVCGNSDYTVNFTFSGSSKKFKITVDDSGIIPATEVI